MKKGFYFVAGNKGIFLETDKQRKTDNIARAIIDEIAKIRKVAPETIERAKADAPTLADIKRRTESAILEEKTTQSGYKYFTISGKYFVANFPAEDFKKEIILA